MEQENTGARRGGLETVCRLFIMAVGVSFMGWCFEKLGRYLAFGSSADRGFLTLPLCPIYGISVVAIYLFMGTPKHISGVWGKKIRMTRPWRRVVGDSAWRKYLFYFIFVAVLSTAAELITGLCMKPFGVMLWDYSGKPFNFMGVICLEYSLMWGALITAFMGLLWKPLWRLVKRIVPRYAFILSVTLAVPIIADFTVGIVHLALTGERFYG